MWMTLVHTRSRLSPDINIYLNSYHSPSISIWHFYSAFPLYRLKARPTSNQQPSGNWTTRFTSWAPAASRYTVIVVVVVPTQKSILLAFWWFYFPFKCSRKCASFNLCSNTWSPPLVYVLTASESTRYEHVGFNNLVTWSAVRCSPLCSSFTLRQTIYVQNLQSILNPVWVRMPFGWVEGRRGSDAAVLLTGLLILFILTSYRDRH